MPLNNVQLSAQLKAEQTGAAATPDLGTLTQVTHQLLIPATVYALWIRRLRRRSGSAPSGSTSPASSPGPGWNATSPTAPPTTSPTSSAQRSC